MEEVIHLHTDVGRCEDAGQQESRLNFRRRLLLFHLNDSDYARLRRRARPATPRRSSKPLVGSGAGFVV